MLLMSNLREICLWIYRIKMIARLIQTMISIIGSHLKVGVGAVFCLTADLLWDWVAVATLSLKSVAETDFSSLLAARCSP